MTPVRRLGPEDKTPVHPSFADGDLPEGELPIIMSDSRLIATVMRQVIADIVTKPLADLTEQLGALNHKTDGVVSALTTLQGRMAELEKRQTSLETKWSSPNKVAWVALFLSLVEFGALVATIIMVAK